MTKNPVLYKTLVVGVIVLFIGVGVQPEVAVTSNTTDSDDNCELCPKVSNQQYVRLKSLIDTIKNEEYLVLRGDITPIVDCDELIEKLIENENLSEKYFEEGNYLLSTLYYFLYVITYLRWHYHCFGGH